MVRPLRLEHPGALYHITARGDRQEPIFADDADRLRFLDLLAKEVTQQGWLLYAFCLMSNHYHLLLETPGPTLVRGMRRLNGVYTQAFNRRHGQVGHLLQGRYKAILVDKDAYLLELCRYVVLNPVRAGMVKDAGDWPWSSYRATAGLEPCPPWLAALRVLAWFGASAARYVRFVAQGVGAPSPWEHLRGQIYLGEEAFLKTMQAKARGKAPRGVARRQLEPLRPSPEAVLAAVARAHHLSSTEVLTRSHPAAFKQAVYLLRRRANLSLAEVSIARVSQIQSEIDRGEPDTVLLQLLTQL